MTEKQLHEQFYKQLRRDLNVRGQYKIIGNANLNNYTSIGSAVNRRADFLILKGEFPFIIIEIVNSDLSKTGVSFSLHEKVVLIVTGADHYVFTDGENFIICNKEDEATPKSQNWDQFISLFDTELRKSEIIEFKQQIAKEIRSIVQEFVMFQSPIGNNPKSLQQILRDPSLHLKIDYNKEGRFFHFIDKAELGTHNFESNIFQSLLEPVAELAVCRYTTLDSLYYMLANKRYRMGSNIAMNDRGEIDYVDKYLETYYKPLHSLTIDEMIEINKSYISSCTTIEKEDDLTMYRLYGDDSKGVCLCFNLSKPIDRTNVIVRKISYATSSGNNPALDFLKQVITTLNTKFKISFRFLYLNIWKHFFKSFDYSLEQEVRVLYVDNKSIAGLEDGWILTNTDRILSKYILFPLDSTSFPLKLAKITLGPNAPEVQLNKRQIEVLLAERNIRNVKVEISKIESYRKS